MSKSKLHGVKQEYARLAGEYDQRWSSYIASTNEQTIRRLSLRSEDRLLDIGCGTGVLLEQVGARWPTVHAVGVDLSREMLAVAQRRLGDRTPLVEADVSNLPFASDSFDVIVSNSSLHYWPNPKLALAEVARVLRQPGELVITDWCGDYLTCRLLDFGLRLTGRAQERAYRSSECVTLLEQSGFQVKNLERSKLNWFWGTMIVDAA